MREQSEYCDVTLISQEGEKFPAHRLILGVTSSYLRAKMQKNSVPKIVMKTVKTEVLSALLSFIYEGKAVIKEADTEPFIETAQTWKIRQFLRLKRKNPGKITNPDNAGVDGGVGAGGLRTETAPQRTEEEDRFFQIWEKWSASNLLLAEEFAYPCDDMWSQANMGEQTEFCAFTLISQEGQGSQTDPRCDQLIPPGEIQRNSGSEIVMKTFKPKVLSALLSFIYEGKAVISEDETEPFLETAQKWKIRQFLRLKRKRKPAESQSCESSAFPDTGGGARTETTPQGQN